MRRRALFLIGAALGLVLHHAAFGFTRAYRRLVTAGDGAGVRAQLLMLALATALFAPVLAAGEAFGHPVVGAVAPASLSVFVGAFVFAIGMQLGGGGGSGTLYQIGAGRGPLVVTLALFVVFSPLVDGRSVTFEAVPAGFRDRETRSTWNLRSHAVKGAPAGRRLTPVPHVDAFWFAWAAFNPSTSIYGSP